MAQLIELDKDPFRIYELGLNLLHSTCHPKEMFDCSIIFYALFDKLCKLH